MKPYHKVSLAYLLTGVVWIVGSDTIASWLAPSRESYAFIQTIKGWFFVFASSLLIYALCKRFFEQVRRAEAEKQAVFRKTLEGSHHILLNYLNQMQIVVFEARATKGFDPAVLEFAQRVSAETAEELKNLEGIELGGPEEIEAYIYRGLRETREAVERTAASQPKQ